MVSQGNQSEVFAGGEGFGGDGEREPRILAVAVGNSRTRFGLFVGSELHRPQAARNTTPEAVAARLAEVELPAEAAAVVMASVNDPFADALRDALDATALAHAPRHRVGRDLPIPIRHTLDDPTTVGHDRLLNALGAYSRAGQACVVVDCGTATTVDFVDGEGVFHGGAILPGVQMMLDQLHARTSALPEVRYERAPPDDPPFAKDTRSAMILGVTASVVGAIHHLVQRYAMSFGAYPQIVATGGDAPTLLEHDDVIEHIVPDLQLIGIHAVCARILAGEEPGGEADDAAG